MIINKKSDDLIELMKMYLRINHISYEELARRMNVSYSSINNWLHRGKRPNRISINKIIDFLDKQKKGMNHERYEEY